MLQRKIMAAAIGIVALLPMAAVASTINPSSNIATGGSYDMLGGAYFYAEAFNSSDVAGSREFTFTNGNTVSENLLLTTATVNTLSEMFTGGVTFKWLTSGLTLFVNQAATHFSGSLDNMIAADSSDTLRISYGDPRKRTRREGIANFSVEFDASEVSPVPLPAGGLLLLGALGGLTALRRRKSV